MILYVCDECYENSPECCGRKSNDQLRVLPNSEWICDMCYQYRLDQLSADDIVCWNDLPAPPKYVPEKNINELS